MLNDSKFISLILSIMKTHAELIHWLDEATLSFFRKSSICNENTNKSNNVSLCSSSPYARKLCRQINNVLTADKKKFCNSTYGTEKTTDTNASLSQMLCNIIEYSIHTISLRCFCRLQAHEPPALRTASSYPAECKTLFACLLGHFKIDYHQIPFDVGLDRPIG